MCVGWCRGQIEPGPGLAGAQRFEVIPGEDSWGTPQLACWTQTLFNEKITGCVVQPWIACIETGLPKLPMPMLWTACPGVPRDVTVAHLGLVRGWKAKQVG